MKICSKCKVEKLLTEFYKDLSKKDGLCTHCTSCRAEYRLANRELIAAYSAANVDKKAVYDAEYRAKNSDLISAKKSQYYTANRERLSERAALYRSNNREKIAKYQATYLIKNRERVEAKKAFYRAGNRALIAARGAAYYYANREKVSAKNAAWRKANYGRHAEHCRNRRARKLNAEGKHTASDVLAIFEKQKGLCANCETKLFKSGKQKYPVDHIMPRARGGSNWPSNLQCLCPACNLSKGAKHPDDWAKQQGRLI